MEETGTGRVGWRVDDRPLSWWTRVYVLGMRLRRDKPAFAGGGAHPGGGPGEAARRALPAGDPLVSPAVDRLVDRGRCADVQLTVHELPALFHVWTTRLTRRDGAPGATSGGSSAGWRPTPEATAEPRLDGAACR